MQVCRLCATTIKHGKGVQLFSDGSTHWDKLVFIICAYLDVECYDDGLLPNWLCSACQLDSEATEKFLCLVREAQVELRAECNTLVEPVEFEFKDLKLTMKRGRKSAVNITEVEEKIEQVTTAKAEALIQAEVDVSGRSKRMRRAPKRFINEVGQQMNKTSPSSSATHNKQKNADEDACARITKAPIAELRSASGISMAEVIEVGTEKKTPICHSKLRLICEYCKEVFSKQNAFLNHVATHKNCVFECSDCLQHFSTKSDFEAHQKATQHTGLGIIENISTSDEAADDASSNDKFDDDIDDEVDGNDDFGAETTAEAAINIVVGVNGQITHIDKSKMELMNESGNSSVKPRRMLRAKGAVKGGAATYACLKCDKTFTDHYAVRRHYRQVHEASQPFKCRQCGACFKTKSSYNYHMAKHTGQKPHLCSVCGSSFIFKYELTLHNRVHTGDQPYKCKQCDKAFSHRSNLVVHERLHAGLRPFKCAKCDAAFNTTSHLHAHKQVHLKQAQAAIAQANSESTLEETTEFLDYHFGNTEPKLQTPSKIVSLLKSKNSVARSTVESSPTNERTQIIHLEISSPLPDEMNIAQQQQQTPVEYKYQCQKCFKYFCQKSTLDKHMRTHTGDKPYKCPLCPKSFADGSNFKRHKLLHKNASDELRNVATNSASALKQQMREMANNSSSSSTPEAANANATAVVVASANLPLESQTVESQQQSAEVIDEEAFLLQFFNDNAANDTAWADENSQAVCITHSDPTTPLDSSKLTTFYATN